MGDKSGNRFDLKDPLYESGDGRIKIYRDNDPSEHQMLVDEEHYVALVRGTLEGVAREERGTIDYVMGQLCKVNVAEEEVVQAMLRGRIFELKKHNSTLIEENLTLIMASK